MIEEGLILDHKLAHQGWLPAMHGLAILTTSPLFTKENSREMTCFTLRHSVQLTSS